MIHADGLSVRVEGSGPGLLLLHGFTGSGLAWPAAAVEPLLDSFTVARVDLPGHGASRLSAAPSEWTPFRTVERLATVQQSCFGGPATWMGYSMGGRLALLAATAGVPMRALLLESASPGLESETERTARRARDQDLAEQIERGGIDAFVESWMNQPLFASQSGLSESVRAAEQARRRGNDPAQLALALRGLGTGAQPSLHDRLQELKMPVSLLTGALDLKFTEVARMMAARLPFVSSRTIKNTGHAVHLEAPREWANWVLASANSVAPATKGE